MNTIPLAEALARLNVPIGQTTQVNALLAGDLACGRWSIEQELFRLRGGPIPTPEDVRAAALQATVNQRDCGRDWEYWGWEGERAYRAAQGAVLAAAAVLDGQVPDLPVPDTDGLVVMDSYGRWHAWAADLVLAAARIAAGRGMRPAAEAPPETP